VQMRLDRDLGAGLGAAKNGRRHVDEVPHAADLENDAVGATPDQPAAEAGDHATTSSTRGASAWQIATARASAAWFGVGIVGSVSIVFTIRCTCVLSACP